MCALRGRRGRKIGLLGTTESTGSRRRVLGVIANGAMDALLGERKALIGRIEQEREQLDRMRAIVSNIEERLAHDERMLGDIDSVLGRAPQLRLEEADVRLRGQRLEAIAIQVLAQSLGPDAEVHYRQWFELLRAEGHVIAGKEPLNTFLSQINRSEAVESVGRRTGRYRLAGVA